MIYTVTLNPAIDKTIQLNNLTPGELNIAEQSLTDIGGKGINVSKVLKSLGAKSIALGLAGGENARYITDGLSKVGISYHFLDTGHEIRTNIKIMESDGRLTELNEKGAPVPESLIGKFVEEVKGRIKKDDILILSGSVPPGVGEGIYADLINIAHAQATKVILDADGELFYRAVEAGPDVIKPNISEFRRYLLKEGNKDVLTEDIIIEAVKKYFFEKNISNVILSMGDKGAYFFDKNSAKILYGNIVPVMVKSTVGAGDSMVAAWAYAMSRGYDFDKAAGLAMATSAAAVITPGTMAPDTDKIAELEERVNRQGGLTYV